MNSTNHIDYNTFAKELIELWQSESHSDVDRETTIKHLHERFIHSLGNTKDLAREINNFEQLSGASLERIGKAFAKATKRAYSPGHISKLCKVGRVLAEVPILDQVNDIEKLFLFASVPIDKLQNRLITEPLLVTLSRSELKKTLQSIFPGHIKSRSKSTTSARADSVDGNDWCLETLRDALIEAVNHLKGDEQELLHTIHTCLEAVDEMRSSKTFACESNPNETVATS